VKLLLVFCLSISTLIGASKIASTKSKSFFNYFVNEFIKFKTTLHETEVIRSYISSS
jgi:hypothetical protein